MRRICMNVSLSLKNKEENEHRIGESHTRTLTHSRRTGCNIFCTHRINESEFLVESSVVRSHRANNNRVNK